MDEAPKLRLHFESASSPILSRVLDPAWFDLNATAEEADAIIFNRDDPEYVQASPCFQRWPEKCLAVHERDDPTFFLPGIYAGNYAHWLSRGRTKTSAYLTAREVFPNPLLTAMRELGRPRKYVVGFMGGSTSWVRKRLFKEAAKSQSPDVLIRCTDEYLHWDTSEKNRVVQERLKEEYADTLSQSAFFLCPRGAGHGSVRLFEVMEMGICPIILADGYQPPEGPDWAACALFIPEKEVRQVVEFARQHADEAVTRGARAREEYERFFAPGVQSRYLAAMMRELLRTRNTSRERFIHAIYPVYNGCIRFKSLVRKRLKRLVLRFFQLSGAKFPYALNRTIEERLRVK